MRNAAILLMLGGAILLAGRAEAAEPFKLDTTADLLGYCDSEGPAAAVRDGQAFCDGFIMGTGLFYLELVRAGTIQRMACAEPTPALAQVRAAFVSWAKANPQQLGAKPIDGFWQAMAATYPCRQ
jgi:hypothetical protein